MAVLLELILAALIISASTPVESLTLVWPDGPYCAEIDDWLAISINMWNLESAEGTAVMTYHVNGTISFTAELRDLKIEDPESWVLGYPEVYYGYNPWSLSGVYGRDNFKLPAKVDELPLTDVIVNYTISKVQKSLPLNFAFDIWLTKEEFSRQVGPGDVELMIWLYSDHMSPAGVNYQNITLPVVLNGQSLDNSWEVWIGKIYESWLIVTLRSSHPLIGHVKINLNEYLDTVDNMLKGLKISSITQHYLESIHLGSEFGSPFTKNASFAWKLYELTFSLPKPQETTYTISTTQSPTTTTELQTSTSPETRPETQEVASSVEQSSTSPPESQMSMQILFAALAVAVALAGIFMVRRAASRRGG